MDINEKVLELSEMPKTKPTPMDKIFAKGFCKRCVNGQYTHGKTISHWKCKLILMRYG